MKIIIIGGTGTIGQAVAKELSQRHSVELILLTATPSQLCIKILAKLMP